MHNKRDPIQKKHNKTYELVAPEGGWGYVVTIGMSLMITVTVGPLCAFGIIYGNFLAQLGNEAGNTTLLTCVLTTAISFMGLIANRLFKTYSCRAVGILGSIIYFLGNFLTTFATSLTQIIITFGVLQGAGFGLMITAAFTSFTEYFVVRKNLMMSISQTILAATVILQPLFARFLIDTYGYRGTVAIFSAMSLNGFLAMLTLQPIRKHLRKVWLSENELENVNNAEDEKEEAKETSFFLDNEGIKNGIQAKLSSNKMEEENKARNIYNSLWDNISDFFILDLLKDPIYMNISIGLTFSFTSDVIFVSVLPMYLTNLNFGKNDVAFLMTLLMCSDLIGRVCLSIMSGVASFKNRTLFLFGTSVTILLRIGITLGDWRYWIITMIVLLGLVRCLIQVLIVLVLAEYPKHNFTASYGMYMTISGFINLILGPLSSAVGTLSSTGVSIVHLLTLLLLLCAIPWLVELTIIHFKHSETKDVDECKITPPIMVST